MKILRGRKFCGWPHEQSRFGVPLQFPRRLPCAPSQRSPPAPAAPPLHRHALIHHLAALAQLLLATLATASGNARPPHLSPRDDTCDLSAGVKVSAAALGRPHWTVPTARRWPARTMSGILPSSSTSVRAPGEHVTTPGGRR